MLFLEDAVQGLYTLHHLATRLLKCTLPQPYTVVLVSSIPGLIARTPVAKHYNHYALLGNR
jgi:hypothetical protein